MHSAPAVRYPVARSARVGAWLLGFWTLAVAVCCWWWLFGGATASQVGVTIAVLVVGGAVACAQWRRMPAGALRWDGQAWWWQFAAEDEIVVSIQVHADLQHGVLLRMKDLPWSGRWCYVEQDALPARWADLRRALYASRPAASDPAGGAVLRP